MIVPDEHLARESLLLRGVLDMCVLALLLSEPLHAYGIVQRLQSHGFENASYGTIYPLVTRLRNHGLVEQSLEESPSGPARNVLTINAAGRAALEVWTRDWEQTTETTRLVLSAAREPGGADVR